MFMLYLFDILLLQLQIFNCTTVLKLINVCSVGWFIVIVNVKGVFSIKMYKAGIVLAFL